MKDNITNIFRWIIFFPLTFFTYFIFVQLVFYALRILEFIMLFGTRVEMSETRITIITFLEGNIIAPFIASVLSIFVCYFIIPKKKKLFTKITSTIISLILIGLCVAPFIIYFLTGEKRIFTESNSYDYGLWASYISGVVGVFVGYQWVTLDESLK